MALASAPAPPRFGSTGGPEARCAARIVRYLECCLLLAYASLGSRRSAILIESVRAKVARLMDSRTSRAKHLYGQVLEQLKTLYSDRIVRLEWLPKYQP